MENGYKGSGAVAILADFWNLQRDEPNDAYKLKANYNQIAINKRWFLNNFSDYLCGIYRVISQYFLVI